jgi:SPRY domain
VSFKKQCLQLDSATRDNLTTRLDYYQVIVDISMLYKADPSLTVVDNKVNVKVTKNKHNSIWHGFIWDASIPKYTLTVDSSLNMDIMVGFAPFKYFSVSSDNSNGCGWYLRLNNGCLHSQTLRNADGVTYSTKCKVGDIITCVFDASKGEIFYEKNCVSLGDATFTDVKGVDIAPAVELHHFGDSVTLSTV